MLARSPSRRRRASRSGGSSPQPGRSTRTTTTTAQPPISPGRRASIAVSPIDSAQQRYALAPEMTRSPRHSIIPDISLESRSNSSTEDIPMAPRSPRHSLTPNLSPRGSLIPEAALSPRNSLIPEAGGRSPRHSLVPGDYSRSPRNSLVPESALSPRNSICAVDGFNRSPRNSLVPEVSRSPRHSLVPGEGVSRSSRHSLVPDNAGSRLNLDFNRSPRGSLLPDGTRGALRQVVVPQDEDDEPSPEVDTFRHHKVSPRGSIASEHSPRGSIGQESNFRTGGGLAKTPVREYDREKNDRSPRGSLTLTFQDPPAKYPRRYSTDYGQRGRATSPYRSSRGNINHTYASQSTCNEGGSRRASSSVSQVSGDEQKRLFSEKSYTDGEQTSIGIGLTLTTYGSVAYQLKDANLEANDTCDFIFRALQIFNKTVVVTVVLVFLSTLPLIMLIMGAQFLRDCPREQHIPIYMVVGGTVGCVKMAWVLWDQLYTRRLAAIGATNQTNIASRILSIALTIFLIAWFALGNYWILRIKWPDYNPTLFEPNRWCHRTLYVFAIVHLFIIYSIVGAIALLVVVLASCQALGCPWLGITSSYK